MSDKAHESVLKVRLTRQEALLLRQILEGRPPEQRALARLEARLERFLRETDPDVPLIQRVRF